MNIGIYVRISDDPLKLRAGVERQLTDCHKIATQRWPDTPVQVFQDNDISAWSGKRRPGYIALCDAIAAGTVTAVIGYNLDRMFRQPKELEAFIELCQHAKLHDVVTAEGDLDLTSDNGQLHARILTAVAKKASDDTSRRVIRALASAKEQGRVPGKKSWVREHPAQLAAAEWAAAEIVNGARMNTVYRQIPDRYPGARQLTSLTSFRHALLSEDFPRVTNDPVTVDLLQMMLRDPRRRHANHSTERVWWLAGVLVCDLCGTKMRHTFNNFAGRHVGRYTCPAGGCMRVSCNDVRTEILVYGLLVGASLNKRTVHEPASTGERHALETRLAIIMDDYSSGVITRMEWEVARARIQDALHTLTPREVTIAPIPLKDRWPTMTATERYDIACLYLDAVRVRPSKVRGGRTIDPDRYVAVWRQ